MTRAPPNPARLDAERAASTGGPHLLPGPLLPGNYARAYLEGRLTEAQLDGFPSGGLDAGRAQLVPPPVADARLLAVPDGVAGDRRDHLDLSGPVMKYLQARGLAETAPRKVWAFLGDGEMDEPESMGATALAGATSSTTSSGSSTATCSASTARCAATAKIIQELEADFAGPAGTSSRVIWGSRWDPLLTADVDGALVKVMEDCVDGDYQTFKSRDGAYVREHFFGRDPRLLERVADMSDDEIWLLNRAAMISRRCTRPTTRRSAHRPADGDPGEDDQGYGMGVSGEAR